MSERATVKTQSTSAPDLAESGVLQRKCIACGNHTMLGGTCAECKGKRAGIIQRAAMGPEPVNSRLIAHEALPGRLSDEVARTFIGPRFGRDFSGLQVH